MILIVIDANGIRTDINTDGASFHAHLDSDKKAIKLNNVDLLLFKEYSQVSSGHDNWIPNKRALVTTQVARMEVGDIREVDYGTRLDTFRMTLSSWARERGVSFKTKVSLDDKLIVKRIK